MVASWIFGTSTAQPEAELARENVKPTNSINFDQNSTQLFKFLEKKNWRDAKRAIVSSPNETSTWIYRKTSGGDLIWRLLPIHAAIMFKAPDDILEDLINAYPEGCASKDDRGMLPLHLAFKNGSSDAVIYALMQHYPKGAEERDTQGRTPMELYRPPVSDFPEEETVTCKSCSIFPQFLDERDETTTVSERSSPINKATKISGMALYMDSALESKGNSVKREIAGEVEETIKLAEDDFNTRVQDMEMKTAAEIESMKEAHVAEMEQKIEEVQNEAAEKVSALEQQFAEKVEIHEEEIEGKDNEIKALNEAHNEAIEQMKREMNGTRVKLDKLRRYVNKGFESFFDEDTEESSVSLIDASQSDVEGSCDEDTEEKNVSLIDALQSDVEESCDE